jgi:hypothetical protein
MRERAARTARFMALTLAIAATGAGAISIAADAQAAACGEARGVTVVVDNGSPGGTSIGCATGDPATGLDALKSSGHRYTFMPTVPGFVCTIDARPDPCNNGPVNAYWSYWHAQPGGSWSYASTAAGSYDPKQGSVEGWSFGNSKPPSSPPPEATTSGTTTAGAAAPEGTPTALGAKAPASATRQLASGGSGGRGGLALGVALVILLGGMAAYLARRRQHLSD